MCLPGLQGQRVRPLPRIMPSNLTAAVHLHLNPPHLVNCSAKCVTISMCSRHEMKPRQLLVVLIVLVVVTLWLCRYPARGPRAGDWPGHRKPHAAPHCSRCPGDGRGEGPPPRGPASRGVWRGRAAAAVLETPKLGVGEQSHDIYGNKPTPPLLMVSVRVRMVMMMRRTMMMTMMMMTVRVRTVMMMVVVVTTRRLMATSQQHH